MAAAGGEAGVGPLAIIAAILLPPLGLFLVRGITPAFWISVLLTLIGWLPGVIFTLVVLLRPDLVPKLR
ncbi:YqaE/Pmp3 family membrane protein [Sphingomonas oleivorans]|uniref:YqaE/Pmp3 family membrane protein n=1 Tax=Sphingomonas oleivorans TaxID=1735121 RepID=A0A2T5G1P6_9SPHN|nr:YqaE/Pmp3 family membrane protein [Sphingomonas oleivorans]PTQ13062.1 YqaE/Pmp3 family membrane protein [Sphingomonas oleivorans]